MIPEGWLLDVVLRNTDNMHRALPKWQQLISCSFLSEQMKVQYEQLVLSRFERLEHNA